MFAAFFSACKSAPKKTPGRVSLAILRPVKASEGKNCFGAADANGFKDGVWWCFYDSGRLRAIMEFKNGLQHGSNDTWDEKGQKLFESEWRNGKIEGRSRLFFGLPCHQIESNYANGFLSGSSKHYDAKCHLRVVMNYREGYLHGSYQEFWPEGQAKIKGQFNEGEEVGKWVFTDCRGKSVATETDLDNLKDCPQDNYNPFLTSGIQDPNSKQ